MTQKLAHFKYRFTKLFHSHQAFVVTTIVLCVLLLVFARINVLNEMPEDQVYLDAHMNPNTLLQ